MFNAAFLKESPFFRVFSSWETKLIVNLGHILDDRVFRYIFSSRPNGYIILKLVRIFILPVKVQNRNLPYCAESLNEFFFSLFYVDACTGVRGKRRRTKRLKIEPGTETIPIKIFRQVWSVCGAAFTYSCSQ